MIEAWRWYGSNLDAITLAEIRQTGATSIVTALHEIPYGEVWPAEMIAARRGEIEAAGLSWQVCESLPVHESIKRGSGDLERLFAAYRQSLANLAAEGVKTICYNFMPLLDWTRTDLAHPTDVGGTCLRFSAIKMAAFELCLVGRDAAEDDYPQEVVAQAKAWFDQAGEEDLSALQAAVMAGMPGAFDRYDPDGLAQEIDQYRDIDAEALRTNYARFLRAVMPTAEELGMTLCVHQDDPPRDLLGLPRIVSCRDDLAWIASAYDSPANGVTLCTGSLGANPANDVPAIAAEFRERIHFAHFRNVTKEPDGSFEESEHLGGDVDIVAVVRVLLEESKRRENAHGSAGIPFRPDHGHELLSDFGKGHVVGYPLIGRLKGLAELRGVITGVAP